MTKKRKIICLLNNKINSNLFELSDITEYTFAYSENSYVSKETSVDIKSKGGILCARFSILIKKAWPAWTNVTIGHIKNWNSEYALTMVLVTTISAVPALHIKVEEDGTVTASSHGAISNSSACFYGNETILL